jgi:F-type H+-transporting ATPase subunit gamma
MSDSSENLRHRINGASDLQSVVRTMKALAASSIRQYERAVESLEVYYQTVEMGLVACLRQTGMAQLLTPPSNPRAHTGIIVFGSDQGLIGQFNDLLAAYVAHAVTDFPEDKRVWAIGERMRDRLQEHSLAPCGVFNTPNSVSGITSLVGQILLAVEACRERGEISQMYLFHNRSGATPDQYAPVMQRLLPLDRRWRHDLTQQGWPTNNLPETLGSAETTLWALIREYLFVSLYRACAESLASENASRLVAMQRAEKNIDGILDELSHTYHQLRQESIDAELFDVVAGFSG